MLVKTQNVYCSPHQCSKGQGRLVVMVIVWDFIIDDRLELVGTNDR